MQQVDNLLSIKEIASYFGMSRQSRYRIVKATAIPAYQVGGAWRFRLREIEGRLRTQPPTNLECGCGWVLPLLRAIRGLRASRNQNGLDAPDKWTVLWAQAGAFA